MNKHAQGPWVVGEDDELNGCQFIPIFAADGGCIAEVVPDYSEDNPRLGKREWATAHVIAAGHDMLEALREIGAITCAGARGSEAVVRKIALDAIAKAEGRSNG